MTPIAFLDIGFPELCVLAFVGLALYGGRLPEVMRSLGAAYRKLRNSVEGLTRETSDMQREVKRQLPQLPRLYDPQPPKDPAALPRRPPTAAPGGAAPAAVATPPPPPTPGVPGAMPSDADDSPPV